jgi:hypothetical protein
MCYELESTRRRQLIQAGKVVSPEYFLPIDFVERLMAAEKKI